jgi:hypothetical protein
MQEASLPAAFRSFLRPLRPLAPLVALIATALALVSAAPALSQTPIDQADESAAAAPVAHVYVASTDHVYAFSAAADGKLTPVPGSPFNDSLSWIAANSHYLFGTEADGATIASFSMASDGALKKVASINTTNFYSGRNGGGGCSPYFPVQFRIDHSGKNLYNAVMPEDGFCGSVFQTFSINNDNGELTYLGASNWILNGTAAIDLLGNNDYAYSPECTAVDGNDSYFIVGYKRLTSGELDGFNTGPYLGSAGPIPPDPSGQGNYCPTAVAPDPTNHMAVMLQDIGNPDDGPIRHGVPAECCTEAPVIATYTAAADGKISTTSTYHNMPSAETVAYQGYPTNGLMRMSPSGKLLAVVGSGLEIFHFNGANPITKYKTLLANKPITQVYWDNNNHLYAIEWNGTSSTGKLYVYTVSPTSATEAPGSPYTISSPGNMTVHTL